MVVMAARRREQVDAEVRPGEPTLVTLRGELDFGDTERLRELLLLGYAAGQGVLVDVSDATFVDGAILAVLVHANARCQDGLRVRGATGAVARMFGVAELDHLLVADGAV